jgi:hypothetical protein
MMKILRKKYPLLDPQGNHDTLCANVVVFSSHTAAEYLAGMDVLRVYLPWIEKRREWFKKNKNKSKELGLSDRPSFFSPS